jgi:hypothetical protein
MLHYAEGDVFGAVYSNLNFLEKAALHWDRDFVPEYGNLNCKISSVEM